MIIGIVLWTVVAHYALGWGWIQSFLGTVALLIAYMIWLGFESSANARKVQQ